MQVAEGWGLRSARQVGKGSFGTVFCGRERAGNRFVAVKVFREADEDFGLPADFLIELGCLQAVDHPNVLRVLGVQCQPAALKLEGMQRTLRHHYQRGLDAAARRELARQLYVGVGALHDLGFAHRDLSCNNVLVNDRNQLRVADPGVAARPEAGMANLLDEGSLYYRAPEVLLGVAAYDTRVDLWACGCLVYEMFAGRFLFSGSCGWEMLVAIFRVLGHPARCWPNAARAPHYVAAFPNFKGQGLDATFLQEHPEAAALLAADPGRRALPRADPSKSSNADNEAAETGQTSGKAVAAGERNACSFEWPVPRGYLDAHPHVNARMRDLLVEWVLEVCDNLRDARPNTAELAVLLIDTYLARDRQIARDKLQLLGSVATLVAHKLETTGPMHFPKDLIYLSDGAFTKEEILAFEREFVHSVGTLWPLTRRQRARRRLPDLDRTLFDRLSRDFLLNAERAHEGPDALLQAYVQRKRKRE